MPNIDQLTSLLTAIGALLAALAAVITAIRRKSDEN